MSGVPEMILIGMLITAVIGLSLTCDLDRIEAKLDKLLKDKK